MGLFQVGTIRFEIYSWGQIWKQLKLLSGILMRDNPTVIAKMMSKHRDSSGGVKGGIVMNLEEVLAEVLRTCLEILKTC